MTNINDNNSFFKIGDANFNLNVKGSVSKYFINTTNAGSIFDFLDAKKDDKLDKNEIQDFYKGLAEAAGEDKILSVQEADAYAQKISDATGKDISGNDVIEFAQGINIHASNNLSGVEGAHGFDPESPASVMDKFRSIADNPEEYTQEQHGRSTFYKDKDGNVVAKRFPNSVQITVAEDSELMFSTNGILKGSYNPKTATETYLDGSTVTYENGYYGSVVVTTRDPHGRVIEQQNLLPQGGGIIAKYNNDGLATSRAVFKDNNMQVGEKTVYNNNIMAGVTLNKETGTY